MEYKNRGEHEEAQVYFDRLQERFPDYVAAYFHAGANLVSLGRRQDAIVRYEQGAAAARRAGDGHALDEIEGALAQLEST